MNFKILSLEKAIQNQVLDLAGTFLVVLILTESGIKINVKINTSI